MTADEFEHPEKHSTHYLQKAKEDQSFHYYSNEKIIRKLIDKMTIEEKVGQVIQGDLEFIDPSDIKQFNIGSVLNGGNTAPYGNKYSSADDWKRLSKEFYDASIEIDGIKIPVLWGTDAVHGHNNLVGATLFPHNIGLGASRNYSLVKQIGEAIALEVLSTGVAWTFAPTIAAARQLVNHGHITVNNKVVDIPSFQCQINDIIGVKAKSTSKNIIENNFKENY